MCDSNLSGCMHLYSLNLTRLTINPTTCHLSMSPNFLVLIIPFPQDLSKNFDPIVEMVPLNLVLEESLIIIIAPISKTK